MTNLDIRGPLSTCCDASEIDEMPGFCGHCHDHADFYLRNDKGEMESLEHMIERMAGDTGRKTSQGEMRTLRNAGLAFEYPDHSFILTDSGREILKTARLFRRNA